MVHGVYGLRLRWQIWKDSCGSMLCRRKFWQAFCNCSGRSSGPSSSCVLTSTGSGGSYDLGDYINWAAAHLWWKRSKVGLVYRAAHRFLHLAAGGEMDSWERPRPMGSKPRGSGSYILEGDWGTYGELGGEEGEIQQCVGAGRRHGVLC